MVKVSYTDPSSNNDAGAVQDEYGNDAASFAAIVVGNFVSPGDAMPLSMASIPADQPLDPGSNLVIKVGQPVAAQAGRYIIITDLGGAHYRGENADHSLRIEANDARVRVVNNGAESRIIIDPDQFFDLDLASSYTIAIEPGAFRSTAAGSTALVAPRHRSAPTPYRRV